MNRRLLGLASIAAIGLVACSTSKHAAAPPSPSKAKGSSPTAISSPTVVATSAASAPSTLAASLSPVASATPLSFYAAQYLAIVKPGNDAFAVFNALPSTATDAEVGAAAAKVIPIEESADAALLRAQWPPNVATDIRALVTASGPLLGDLADLTASNVDQTNRDAGASDAAANIVRADLGLPPLS